MAITSVFMVLIPMCFWSRSSYGMEILKLNDEEIHAVLAAHNRIRNGAKATAMRKLTYSPDLAREAEQMASQCAYFNNIPGDNMYYSKNTGRPNIDLAIREWDSERNYYNYRRARCAPRRTCKHYTQMVYQNTKEVGCGIAYCDDVANIKATGGHLIVCNYRPIGPANGRRPYTQASRNDPSCSQCGVFGEKFLCAPEAYLCENGEETSAEGNHTNNATRFGGDIDMHHDTRSVDHRPTYHGATDNEHEIDNHNSDNHFGIKETSGGADTDEEKEEQEYEKNGIKESETYN